MNRVTRCVPLAFLAVISIFFVGVAGNSARALPSPQGSSEKAHMDHKPKHGGLFFMSLDNVHHLEGVLLPPGTFRVYLYDEYAKPLKLEQVKLASGTIQIGDSEDAPKIPLGPEKEGIDGSIYRCEPQISRGHHITAASAGHGARLETGIIQLYVRQIHG